MVLATPLALLPLLTLLSAPATASSPTLAVNHGRCYESYINLTVSALNYQLNITAPKDQEAVTDFVVRWTSENSNVTEEVVGESVQNQGAYRVYTVFCVPETQDEGKTVELAIHG